MAPSWSELECNSDGDGDGGSGGTGGSTDTVDSASIMSASTSSMAFPLQLRSVTFVAGVSYFLLLFYSRVSIWLEFLQRDEDNREMAKRPPDISSSFWNICPFPPSTFNFFLPASSIIVPFGWLLHILGLPLMGFYHLGPTEIQSNKYCIHIQ